MLPDAVRIRIDKGPIFWVGRDFIQRRQIAHKYPFELRAILTAVGFAPVMQNPVGVGQMQKRRGGYFLSCLTQRCGRVHPAQFRQAAQNHALIVGPRCLPIVHARPRIG